MGHSRALVTVISGLASASVCGARPNEQPSERAPQRRAVRTSTSESPIMTVSLEPIGVDMSTLASAMSVIRPSGSGFLVGKLLPP